MTKDRIQVDGHLPWPHQIAVDPRLRRPYPHEMPKRLKQKGKKDRLPSPRGTFKGRG